MGISRYGWAKNMTVIYIYDKTCKMDCKNCNSCRHSDSEEKTCAIRDVKYRDNGKEQAAKCKYYENGCVVL